MNFCQYQKFWGRVLQCGFSYTTALNSKTNRGTECFTKFVDFSCPSVDQDDPLQARSNHWKNEEVVISHQRKRAGPSITGPLTHFSIQEFLNLDLCSTHYLLIVLFMGWRDEMNYMTSLAWRWQKSQPDLKPRHFCSHWRNKYHDFS